MLLSQVVDAEHILDLCLLQGIPYIQYNVVDVACILAYIFHLSGTVVDDGNKIEYLFVCCSRSTQDRNYKGRNREGAHGQDC